MLEKPRRCVIVLGMHRSGTSALTGVLSLLGAYPGSTLMPSQADVNPKGFWEHTRIVEIHDRLLDTFGSAWDDSGQLPDRWWQTSSASDARSALRTLLRGEFDQSALWLVKDPRLCRLLPLWFDLFGELSVHPYFVICVRHPAEVARSLKRRDNISEPESCLLWLTNILEAEQTTRNYPRFFVTYDRFLTEWPRVAAEIEQAFCIRWPVSIDQAAPLVQTFLDPALRHYSGDIDLPSHPACHLAEDCYRLLTSMPAPAPALDAMYSQLTQLSALTTPWSRALAYVRKDVRQLRLQNTLLSQEVSRIKNSFSWKVTSPLRATFRVLNRYDKSRDH